MENRKDFDLEFSGERYVPGVFGNIELEHIHRYAMSKDLVSGKAVVDIASGEGYGSFLLSRYAATIVGVDISPEAVLHARRKYKANNLDYRVGSCDNIPLANTSVDVVVSFETIEHHDRHEEMLCEIKRILKPNGVLIISSPEKYECSVKTGSSNPYHVKELYRHEFEDLIKKHFKHHLIYGQRVIFGSSFFLEKVSSAVVTADIKLPNDTTRGLRNPLFLIAIASDIPPSVISSSFLEQSVDESEVIHTWRKEVERITKAYEDEIARIAAEREEQIGSLNRRMVEGEIQISCLTTLVAERDAQIRSILASNSWKSNRFLRILRGAMRVVLVESSRVRTTIQYFREHPQAIRGYVSYARKLGVINSLRHVVGFVKRGGPRHGPVPTATKAKLFLRSKSGQPTVILTTRHCLYVARAISTAMARVGIKSQIIHERPICGYLDNLHFVICPQMFAELPGLYIAFQMEQTVNSRWFTDEYLRILENSAAILDYSTVNIGFLTRRGLSPRQLYYLPIGYIADDDREPEHTDENYDVIFYGDTNNERREKFLREIKKHCRVKIINDLFGAPLHTALARARVVVNIHYYAGALLETTRIWECLSLHKLIISERSSDMDQHSDIMQLVDFVDVDDISSMVERILYWLDNDNLRRQRISENRLLLQQQPNRFDYFFYRFLLATDNITFEDFWHQAGHKAKLPSDTVCLTLPEYVERTVEFNKDNHFGFSCFPGLRHSQSWLGCAMSYKLIIMLARQQCLPQITICEDDVEFPADFVARWRDIQNHLNDQNIDWDIFSGLMADLDKNVHILEAHIYQGQQFVTIDKLISMVFNVYNQRVFDTIAQWDQTNHDVTANTIDRYLENQRAIKILTISPFLVGHKESLQSTLWGIKNTEYADLILTSSRLLKEKIAAYDSGTKLLEVR